MEGGLMFLNFRNSRIKGHICGIDRARRAEVEAALRVIASASRTEVTFTCTDSVHGGELVRVEKKQDQAAPRRGKAVRRGS